MFKINFKMSANSGIMTEERKYALKINFQKFVANLRDIENVLGVLFENEIISNSFMETVMSKPTKTDKNRELLLYLPKYGDRAFDGLLLALEKTNQMELARQISPNYTGQDDNSCLAEFEKIESYTFEDLKIKSLSKADIHRIVSDINNYKINDPNYAGKVIIINNKDFLKLEERGGSEVDVDLLELCFKRLKFHVSIHRELSAMEIREVLHREKFELNKNEHAQVDIFVVAVMSHGAMDYVYGTDGYEDRNMVSVNEIQEIFDGSSCPALITKPKLFFFQACQKDEVMQKNKNLDGITWKKSKAKSSDLQMKTHRLSDIFAMISTVPGFLSWRHPEKGSFFVRTLVYAIATKCHEQELLSIMTDAQRLLTNIEITTPFGRLIQQPELRSTLRKRLYFLP